MLEEVEIRNLVGYQEALHIIKKSHLGLVLAPKQPYQIPAKIYDMIGSDTKVLAIADDGATKEYDRVIRVGRMFSLDRYRGYQKFYI